VDREEKKAEEERDRLLSASHADDDVEDADRKHISDSHSKSTSAEVASSMKEIHINATHQSNAAPLFRKSSSARKALRRVVTRDSDSDDDFIGPPIPDTNSGEPPPQPSLNKADDDDDDAEIGPPAPAAGKLPNVNQGSSGQDESSDEEIGPPLPETVLSDNKRDDSDSVEEKTAVDDDDSEDNDDDDSDDPGDNDEVAVISYCV